MTLYRQHFFPLHLWVIFVWMGAGILNCYPQVPSSSTQPDAPQPDHGPKSNANAAAKSPSPIAPSAPTGAAPITMATIVVTAPSGVGQATIDPGLGIRVYTIDTAQIKTLPQGADTSFDQVVERTPGVSQDAYGSWHVRGEDTNTSYLINGVRIPLGIVNSTFGEKFDTRFISSVSLLDGALPAQYGLNTGGFSIFKPSRVRSWRAEMPRSMAEAMTRCDRISRMAEFPAKQTISSREAMTATILELKIPRAVRIRFMIIPTNTRVSPISAIIWMKAAS